MYEFDPLLHHKFFAFFFFRLHASEQNRVVSLMANISFFRSFAKIQNKSMETALNGTLKVLKKNKVVQYVTI